MNIRQLLVAIVVLSGVTQLNAGGSQKRLFSPREQRTMLRHLKTLDESNQITPAQKKQLRFLQYAITAHTKPVPPQERNLGLPPQD